MKKAVTLVFISFFAILTLISCIGDPSNNDMNSGEPSSTVQKYTREYWGEWKKMDQTETWEISSTSIKVNGNTITKDVVLAKPSENVISVTDGKITYCLYAIRTASSQITGSVESDDGSRGVGGWLPVVVQNINDRFDVTETTTNGEGIFSADKLIPGDEYRITIGDTSLSVTPSFDGEDIGNITLREGVNFKVTLTNSNSLMFAGSQYYSMNLNIENIGDTNCTAATYTLEGDEGLEVINNYSDGVLLRTIAAGEKKTIPLKVRCEVPGTDTAIRKLNLTIKDKDGTVWNDSVSLKFYKETITINVVSENSRPISGVIIGDGRTYTITNKSNFSVEVPVSDERYLLVFSGAIANASRNTESVYSVGVDGPAVPATNLVTELGSGTSNYEPNDDENHAKAITFGDTIVAYLHENDIDYYCLVPAHHWDTGEVLKEATCTEDGLMVFTCTDCGQTKEQVIKSVGHIVDGESIDKKATCTEDGRITGTCIVCGEVFDTIIPASGHSFSSEWVTDDDYHWHAATCGHNVTTEKLSHDWTQIRVINATQTTVGRVDYECSVCGAKKSETIVFSRYSIGDIGPAGGFIFYDCDLDNYSGNSDGLISTECGWRYLEAAPSDLGSSICFGYVNEHNLLNSGTSTGIGSGKRNTQLLIADMGTSAYDGLSYTGNYAAKVCDQASYGGYSDWFLPSKDEIYLMFVNLCKNGKGNFAKNGEYWSSSESSGSYAWLQYFGSEGYRTTTVRGTLFRVRAVRSFL